MKNVYSLVHMLFGLSNMRVQLVWQRKFQFDIFNGEISHRIGIDDFVIIFTIMIALITSINNLLWSVYSDENIEYVHKINDIIGHNCNGLPFGWTVLVSQTNFSPSTDNELEWKLLITTD